VTSVFLGLGSNLGNRWSALSTAVERLRELDPALSVSPVYETEPVGGPGGQGRYLNVVVGLDSDLAPLELLGVAQSLEADAGRVRTVRFGPRTLDVDVLLIAGYHSDDPRLTVPHPRMWERAFVVVPLADVAPDLVPVGFEQRLGGPAAVAAAVRRVGALLPGGRAESAAAG